MLFYGSNECWQILGILCPTWKAETFSEHHRSPNQSMKESLKVLSTVKKRKQVFMSSFNLARVGGGWRPGCGRISWTRNLCQRNSPLTMSVPQITCLCLLQFSVTEQSTLAKCYTLCMSNLIWICDATKNNNNRLCPVTQVWNDLNR